jgi:hypothetical protein
MRFGVPSTQPIVRLILMNNADLDNHGLGAILEKQKKGRARWSRAPPLKYFFSVTGLCGCRALLCKT